MNTKITETTVTTLAAMSQVTENFTVTETKNFYENVIAKLPCIVYWKNKDFKYVFCNEITAIDFLRLNSPSEIVGKTDFDFDWDLDTANWVRQTDEEIIQTGKPLLNTERLVKFGDGRILHISGNRMPLFNSAGAVTGIIGISVDITAQKEAEQLKNAIEAETKNFYDSVMAKLPCIVFWKDKDFKYVFCNEIAANLLKLNSPGEIVGKTDFDFGLELETAQWLRQTDEEILRTEKPLLNAEFPVRINDGTIVHLSGNRMPLFNSAGEVTGIIGISVDITAQKEAELLKLENESQKAILQEQEKFKKIVDQVTHDIRSPLASMLMILKASDAMPEKERIALRTAATRINDIANNLLGSYDKKERISNHASGMEEREALLLSPVILQMLTDKKFQFQDTPVKFDQQFTQPGNFAWIKIEPSAFKRMLSNLINNAVDAFDQKEGEVTLHLDATKEQVRLVVEDNGKGMRPELVQKLINQTAVTEGKQDGHGIGMTQVRETLQNNEGELTIDSREGVGTKMILTFPRVPSQNWIADSMQLVDDDIVVILDDDSSIHMAWNTRFDRLKKIFPNLTVHHFEIGQKCIDFINGLPPEQIQKIFLLTDFELLKQDLNGLDVIYQTPVARTILVTSHYADKQVCSQAIKAGTTILPKQLAYDIPIHVLPAHAKTSEKIIDAANRNIDVVFVDDEQDLLDSFRFAFGHGRSIDTHADPQHFLAAVSQYPKDTRIMLDYQFYNFEKNGIEIAELLHSQGFTRLCLLSGRGSFDHPVPAYLTLIAKTDFGRLELYLKGTG